MDHKSARKSIRQFEIKAYRLILSLLDEHDPAAMGQFQRLLVHLYRRSEQLRSCRPLREVTHAHAQ